MGRDERGATQRLSTDYVQDYRAGEVGLRACKFVLIFIIIFILICL